MRIEPAALLAFTALALCGCVDPSSTAVSGGAAPPPPSPPTLTTFRALYVPAGGIVPYPNDIYFAGTADGTLNSVPVTPFNPNSGLLTELDGYSTTAPISIRFSSAVDASSLTPFNPLAAPTGTENIFVVNNNTGIPLVPGVHYEVGLSQAVDSGDSIVEIRPLAPLDPKTTYAFVVTASIVDANGTPVRADDDFQAIKDAFADGSTLSDPTLEAIKNDAVGPILAAATAAPPLGFGIPLDAIVSAWSVSTQSTFDVLEQLAATAAAQASLLVDTGTTTADLGLGLPGIADIYTGFIEVPYYGDKNNPLTTHWQGAPFTLDPSAPPTTHLTRFNPVPIATETLRIPLLATVPNAFSGQMQPAEGWPVVIYQHGVTSDRTSAFAMADSFAQAGFVVLAIDLPLHGITDSTNPLYQGPENPANPFGNNERHFFRDDVNAGGVPVPDGMIDNGMQIFNVADLLNTRDNFRQAAADLMQLSATIATIDLDGDQVPDLDASRRHFAAISLGSILSTPFLALNTEVTTATLSSPGGTWTQLLTDPDALVFGQPIINGLAAAGLVQGTTNFDVFVRDAQTILDPAESLNYAAAASENHPLHVIEILGDTSVVNSGTERAAALMQLTTVSATTVDPAGVRGVVRFTAGGHTSLLNPFADPSDPAGSAAATTEMQSEMVTFAATNGTTILVTDDSVVQ